MSNQLPDFVTAAMGSEVATEDPADPRYSLTQPEIAELYRNDTQAWRDLFFPEYAGLPMNATVVYGSPQDPRIKGSTPIPELAPWGHGGGPGTPAFELIKKGVAKGPIDPICKRLAWISYSSGASNWGYEEVPIAEYIAWCDSLNWFRNGGITPWNGSTGLDPRVFIGGAWDIRSGKYWANQEDPFYRQPIVCQTGFYFAHRAIGPYLFGANGLFFPHGQRVPSYISDRWGPMWRDNRRIPEEREPSQERYDEQCWKRAVSWL